MAIGIVAALAIAAVAKGVAAKVGAGKKTKIPVFNTIDPTQVQKDTTQDNLAATSDLERLGREVNLANARNQEAAIEAGLPGQLGQARSNIGALLRGEIPTDIFQQVSRSSAAAGFQGGFQGSQLGRNATARDLGITSLGLQQTGLQNFSALSSMLTPNSFNVASMFFSPGQRVTIDQSERNLKYQRDLMAAGVKAAPSPTKAAIAAGLNQFGNSIGQYGSFMMGKGAANNNNSTPTYQESYGQIQGFQSRPPGQ